MRKYNAAHRKEINKRARERRAANPAHYRKLRLPRLYGITDIQYEEMYLTQNGCCAICGMHKEKLCIDYDHGTQKIRGLLCQPCNKGIGFLGDDTKELYKAIAYLTNKSAGFFQAEYRERLRDAGKLKPREAGRISALFAVLLLLTILLAAALMMGCSALDYSPFDALRTPTPSRTMTAITEPERTPVSTEIPGRVITCGVTAPEALNLRAGPGTNYTVTAWLHAGETLTRTSEPARGHWFEVTTSTGARGWVNSNFCKGVKP